MYLLTNDLLSVSILDPATDMHLFGSRYCTGGYIWQIFHKKICELMRGPCYPQKEPPVFDGQGAPEVFESPAPDADLQPVGSPVLVPGVGLVKKASSLIPFHPRNNPEVINFCTWKVTSTPDSITMTTIQQQNAFKCSISREITLDGSTVISSTSFMFTGPDYFPLSWFAHPFFPLNPDFRCCRFFNPVKLPPNDAFTLNEENGELAIRPSFDYTKSSFTLLDIPPDNKFTINQFHPDTGNIFISTDFPVSKMPVWTNQNTFSFEPYFQPVLRNSEKVIWSMIYQF
ncbi:MAG: hypothetical protein JW915_08345 [Chitinispirillaceae bacterium]|nr:hypothetical protein [Chitinispirillaceae bacterium]